MWVWTFALNPERFFLCSIYGCATLGMTLPNNNIWLVKVEKGFIFSTVAV